MFRRIVLLSIVSCMAVLPVAAWADDNAPVTQADLKKLIEKIDKLDRQIQTLKAPAPPIVAPPAEPSPSSGLSAASGTAAKSAEAAESHTPDLAAQLTKLEQRIKVLENAADNQETLNVQLAEWVNGHKVNGQGGVAAIGVKPSVAPPTSGMLLVRNEMSTAQDVVVNGGALYRIEAHAAKTVPVPVGSITTQIRGEAALTWFVGAPTYSQEIIIAPASRNPLSTAVVW
jgi:hypothetical protein